LGVRDAFTDIHTTTNLEIDHRVPVTRLKQLDGSKEAKVDVSSPEDIRAQYQLLTRENNQYKSRVCENCVENDVKPSKFLGIRIPVSIGGGQRFDVNTNNCYTCPLAYPEKFLSRLESLDDWDNNSSLYSVIETMLGRTKEKENEERSAERAIIDLLALGFYNANAIKVSQLIILTKHNRSCSYLSGKVMMDCDLSILGKDTSLFKHYENEIRIEYGHISEASYCEGRINFFQSLLEKEYIYHTDFFRDRYEKKARHNITKSIEVLFTRL
jgi:hypothetical protein